MMLLQKFLLSLAAPANQPAWKEKITIRPDNFCMHASLWGYRNPMEGIEANSAWYSWDVV